MSTDPDKDTACPKSCEKEVCSDNFCESGDGKTDACGKKKKPVRTVTFPDEDHLVTQYFEPSHPWNNVPPTSRSQLAAEYLESCRRHNTPPIDSVLQQIRELPETAIGGSIRAPRLTLAECVLLGSAPADALEALLRKVQFRRLEIEHAAIDDEGAEAMFDMIEYYESATTVSVSGPRQFGIRGWQAVSRMIKKSAELSELEVTESALEASHAPVLARALRPHTCRLRVLCLQRTVLYGEPLLCLVIALKSNGSIRELRLGDNGLSVSDAAQLGSLLRFNTRIQLLDLSNNQIQDAGVGHLADALVEQAAQTPPSATTSPISPHHCPLTGGYEARGLAFLVLWNNQLTRNCAPHLSKALRASHSLCVLNIGRNALGTDTVRALQAGGALISLGLQAARLGPEAARPLQDLIRADTRLQRLDLRDNRLGSAGLQAILNAMKENTTLTQIDLDDPVESSTSLSVEDGDAATVARLTREIRALCRRNEPDVTSPERRVHRKISLTCHTACLARTPMTCEEERRSAGRLRSPAPSPAPSPAGSPVPAQQSHSRFSVTRVTPERESSTDSSSPSTPTRPTYCPTPSRFRVMQVSEPPQIQVHPATSVKPRQTSSRFSVTRNYDSMYDQNLVPSPPPAPTIGRSTTDNTVTARQTTTQSIASQVEASVSATVNLPPQCVTKKSVACETVEATSLEDVKHISEAVTEASTSTPVVTDTVAVDKLKTGRSQNETSRFAVEIITEKAAAEMKPAALTEHKSDSEFSDIKTVKTISDLCDAKYDKTLAKVDEESEKNYASIIKSDKMYSDVLKSETMQCHDTSEKFSHCEEISLKGDDQVLKTETKLVKNNIRASEKEIVDVQVEVTVKKECVQPTLPAKVHSDQNVSKDVDFVNIDEITVNKKDDKAMKQIEAITEDLGNLIQEMKELSTKTAVLTRKDVKFKSDCTQTDVNSEVDEYANVPVKNIRDSIVLKKNRSESSLDSPDLEVSRLMNKNLVGSAFCDSSSSLEISGSSVESLNALDNQAIQVPKAIIIQESVESDMELDRRKPEHVMLSNESSIESNTSEVTPVNSANFLNMSISSNESVSPIIFGKSKKIHDSLSSLEASVSSLDSGRQEKVMVTSADSGIEYSLQNPSEKQDDNSSNEGTLTNNSSLKETIRKPESCQLQDTVTSSPKRTSSLLDVPSLKSKGLDRMRKISWVAPSPSFQILRPESDKLEAKPSHLEKLLSLFQHPTSIFSRSSQSDEEKKSASNTPPRKDSSLTSSFWSWGSTTEKLERDDKEDSSEATDSTLSERVQVSFVDESFSKKLDSKTPSTDTDNTLSEFQSFPIQGLETEVQDIERRIDRVTEITTDDNLVQKCLVLSVKSIDNASSHGNMEATRVSDNTDLIKPNDLNKNVCDTAAGDRNRNPGHTMSDTENIEKAEVKLDVKLDEVKTETLRPRSFAAVLKSSGSENSLDKQNSPDTGQPVDKLPSKVIREIKENISPENTLISTMSNTKALALELSERQIINQPIVNAVWEVTAPLIEKNEPKIVEGKAQCDLAPIATIDETCDEAADNNIQLRFIDDVKDDNNVSIGIVTSLEGPSDESKTDKAVTEMTGVLQNVDLGKDALSYLIYENQDFEPDAEQSVNAKVQEGSLAQELKEAEIKEQLFDLSPELVIDEAMEVPEIFQTNETKVLKTSPVIPERAKLKKANSLENLSQLQVTESEKSSPKTKTIMFKVPETTTPRDIPRRSKLRTRSGSSPKSLPESLNKPCPLAKFDSILSKKKKKVSSLGKMARDSLLALNMSEEEIAEFRRSYKLTSVESLRSLESVSEDANSHSGNSVDSRCRACLRTSQESLMSLDSITEDCKCTEDTDKPGHVAR